MNYRQPIDTRALTEARTEIAAALVAQMAPAEQTLIVKLAARGFVDSYAHALALRDSAALVDWVDRMCRTHESSPVVGKFFAAACDSFEGFLEEHSFDEAFRRPLRDLNGAMRAIVDKPRARVRPQRAQLDEVDAAIEEHVAKLDAFDQLTGEHSRAVSAWCARLSRRLMLSDKETTFVARCGMIHDVGKIMTPLSILHAPRQLTDDEWGQMRAHTTSGELIVNENDRLADFKPAVRHHHERLDGRGYPDRLAGDEISLAIRIVTVADCFNAMIGRRPYRPPMSPALALEELRRNAGTQFDAEIVRAMQQVVSPR